MKLLVVRVYWFVFLEKLKSKTKHLEQEKKYFKLKVHYPQLSRRGPAFARNIGIKESQGDYIHFCDDDDEVFLENYSNINHRDNDIDIYASQLEDILEYVSQLDKINTDNIEPTTRAVEVVNVMRDDLVQASSNREELLDQAPHREGDFFRVPKIMKD